jgi:hypothetical protein
VELGLDVKTIESTSLSRRGLVEMIKTAVMET